MTDYFERSRIIDEIHGFDFKHVRDALRVVNDFETFVQSKNHRIEADGLDKLHLISLDADQPGTMTISATEDGIELKNIHKKLIVKRKGRDVAINQFILRSTLEKIGPSSGSGGQTNWTISVDYASARAGFFS